MFSNSKKKAASFIVIAVFLISIDRFLKILALKFGSEKEINMWGDWFTFNFARNKNIAFSLPVHQIFLNILIPIAIILLLIFLIYLYKKKHYAESGILTMVLFGAISNYTDRLKFGYVIDYLDLRYFTVFNIADAMIVLGMLGFILLNIDFKRYKKHA